MKKLIFIFIFSLLLITPCSAAPYDEASLQDSLPDYARDLAGEATQPASEGLERIESAFTETLSGGLSGVIKRSLSIIAVAVICAVLTVFCDDAPEYVSLGGCAAIAIISVSDVNSFVSSGADVITALSGFSKTLLPAMCAASAACGTLSSATVKYAASVDKTGKVVWRMRTGDCSSSALRRAVTRIGRLRRTKNRARAAASDADRLDPRRAFCG